MIAWRGERVVRLDKLVLPGDIRHRTKLPHVVALAGTIRDSLTCELPVARRHNGKWRLVTGADVVAANILLQRPELRIREVQASDTEATLLQLAEEKRGVTDASKLAALHERIELLQEQALREHPKPKAVQRGRRRSPLSQAVRDVAGATGLDERSLMRSYRRRNQGADSEPEPVTPVAPVILDLGMPLERQFLENVAAVQATVTAALDGLARAGKAMRKLEELPFPQHAVATADLCEVVEKLRRYWPFTVCPYCKGLSGVQEGCVACSMQGWLGKGQIDSVPDKLWDKVDRVVIVNGEPRRVADLLAKEPLS